jgi:hypothetical protein
MESKAGSRGRPLRHGLVLCAILGCARTQVSQSDAPGSPDVRYETVLESPTEVTARMALAVKGAATGVTVFALTDGGDAPDFATQYRDFAATGDAGRALPVRPDRL